MQTLGHSHKLCGKWKFGKEIVILTFQEKQYLERVYNIHTHRSSAEKLNNHSMCLAQASDPHCGFLVTVYDLIWPEGGLCELEEERSPMRFYCKGVEESRGSYSCPSINWLMRNSFMWKTEWITHTHTRHRYTLACKTCACKHTYAHTHTHKHPSAPSGSGMEFGFLC